MKYIIISIILINFIQAEDAKPIPQPIEVQRALAEFEKGAVYARKAYDIETTKLAGRALDQLEKAKLVYMQKGDLEGANIVSAAIKKLNEGEILTAIEDNIKKNSDVLGYPVLPIEKQIIGKWKNGSGHSYEYRDGGVAIADGVIPGKWIVNFNKTKFIITWNNGMIESYNLPIINNAISGANQHGPIGPLTKIPEAK